MTAFEDLKSHWGNQSQPEIPKDGAKRIMEKIRVVQQRQRTTNVVLALTGIILIAFFFYVSAYKFQPVMIGLLMMIGSLCVRIALEFSSIRSLKNMDVSKTAEKFKEQMIRYYRGRIKVHFLLTPIIILVYCIGFVLLLPAFKESLSSGFYNYIIVSSILVLLVLSVFIGNEVRKELAALKELKP